MKSSAIAALAVIAFCALVQAKTISWEQLDGYTFEQWTKDFRKTYDTHHEAAMRRSIFNNHLARIQKHNADQTKTWKESVNQFADLETEEFRVMLGYDQDIGYRYHKPTTGLSMAYMGDLPTSVDWRSQNVVSAVKDQGRCGSCWSFAAAETIESQVALATGELRVLSEQNILDCVKNPNQCGGTGGCKGGTAELAYANLHNSTGGISSEWVYPYNSYFGTDGTCVLQRQQDVAVNVTGYTKLASNSYAPLMSAVATTGPIAISVEAIHWQFYHTGVFDGCNQTNPDIDHAVQLVGYGTDAAAGGDYWLVRNSWSPTWGEKGYIRVRRTDSEDSRCGTDVAPHDGTACSGSPPTVKVCGTCGILFDSCYPTVDKS